MAMRILLMMTAVWLVAVSDAAGRTWTDNTGQQQVEAELLDFNGQRVWLARDDGRIFAVHLDRISRPDRQYVEQETRRRTAAMIGRSPRRPDAIDYAPPRELCQLANGLIDESSGLACSRVRPGVFWTHNDSGDTATIYAFDIRGRDLGSCLLGGVRAFDFEDMASFRMDGKNYLLVGDIGNNGRAATVHILYLVEEPPVHPTRGVTLKQAPVVQTMHFSYHDDHRDCEAMAVDTTSKTILLVTKEPGPECYVYALPWPKNDPARATVARKIATLKIPVATALDVSPDGRRAVVATYSNAFEYARRGDEGWASALARCPRPIPLPRRTQGETICYGPDGKTLYLTSEKRPTPLWEVPGK